MVVNYATPRPTSHDTRENAQNLRIYHHTPHKDHLFLVFRRQNLTTLRETNGHNFHRRKRSTQQNENATLTLLCRRFPFLPCLLTNADHVGDLQVNGITRNDEVKHSASVNPAGIGHAGFSIKGVLVHARMSRNSATSEVCRVVRRTICICHAVRSLTCNGYP